MSETQPLSLPRDTEKLSEAERQHRGTKAVKKMITFLGEFSGPTIISPYHEALQQEFRILVMGRTVDLTKALPAQPDTEHVKLTLQDFDDATQVVIEHDRMTADERREAGIPESDNQDGVPIVADVVSLLEFIDDQDPRQDFSLATQQVTECTNVCKCITTEHGINRKHQRDVLYHPKVNGNEPQPYDPPGTSPRVKELRKEWRERAFGNAIRIRRHHRITAPAMKYVTKAMREMANEIGQGHPGAIEVNPAFVEVVRDDKRDEIGLELQGDQDRRAELEHEYVGDMQELYKEHGYEEPTAKEILGPAVTRELRHRSGRRNPLSRISGRVGELFKMKGGDPENPLRIPKHRGLTEEELAEIDAKVTASLERKRLALEQAPMEDESVVIEFPGTQKAIASFGQRTQGETTFSEELQIDYSNLTLEEIDMLEPVLGESISNDKPNEEDSEAEIDDEPILGLSSNAPIAISEGEYQKSPQLPQNQKTHAR